MKRKGKKVMSIHDKAIALLEGQHVEINGLMFKAVKETVDVVNPCASCCLDSICHEEVVEVCAECDEIMGKAYRLELVPERREE